MASSLPSRIRSILLMAARRGTGGRSARESGQLIQPLGAEGLRPVQDQEDHVGLRKGFVGRRQHGALEEVPGIQESGVSRKIIWARSVVRIPVTRCQVVWALGVTMLRRSPRSAFIRVDFPALGRPTRVTYPLRVSSFSGRLSGIGVVIRGNFPGERRFGNVRANKRNAPLLGRAGGRECEAGGDVLSHRINQQYHSRSGA